MPTQNPQSADHLAAAAGAFEPQRSNNFSFEVALSGNDRDLLVLSLEGFTLPGEANEKIEIPYQNEKRKVAGPATVNDAKLTVRDFVDRESRKAIMRWRKQVYDKATGKIGLAKNYKKLGYVILTAPDGSATRVAKAMGAWPMEIGDTALDMKTAEPVVVEVTLCVDKLVWEDGVL